MNFGRAKVILESDSTVHRILSEFDLLLPAMVVDLINHHYQPRFLSHLIRANWMQTALITCFETV